MQSHLVTISVIAQRFSALQLIDSKLCRELYGEQYVSRDSICAGAPSEGLDGNCAGEMSGSPLIGWDAAGRGVVAGVLSSGYVWGCDDRGYPAVYTDISKHVDWILEAAH